MTTPTLLEMLAFTVLTLLSAGAAWWRFRRVLRTILASRPEAGYHLKPLAPRLREFIGDVILQRKVIGGRPAAGLAHAVVFWGFCAFALVSLDHLAHGFGIELLPRANGAVRGYLWLVAVFAAAVAIAIGALTVRRFLVRPKWLGEISPESGVVAGLIFLLMVTYLAQFLLEPAGVAGKLLWWTHTLSLLVFLPVIPHTKHLHLALAPVTVFLGRGGFSKIPPLAGDEDFGLDTGADLTRITALQAYTCVECGRCMEHCPAANTGKDLNPKELVLGIRAYLNEFGPGAGEALLGKHVSQKAVFECTTCGACEYQCPVGVEHLPLLVGLRRGAVNTGKWEDDYGAKLFVNLERHGNPLGMPARERDKFIEKAGLEIYDGSQEYCLWLGCMGAYDPGGREVVLALAKLMRHLKISFGVLRREKCTGDAARRLGNDLAFEELATWNLERIAGSKVGKMISICPHCVRTISEDWREYGEAPPIEHHSEFLARHAADLPAAGENGGTVVFHDPCYLARYRDVCEEPRAVIGGSVRLVEAGRNRQRSFCCGAGGGLVFLGEEQGERISVERTEQLAETGADTIAVACPFCQTMFRDTLAGRENAPRLADIAQIAAASLPATEEP